MIILITGADVRRRKQHLHKVLAGLQQKRPDAQVSRLDPERDTPETLTELIATSGMFDDKRIVILRDALVDATWKEVMKEAQGELAESEHVFVILEEKQNAATKKLAEVAYQHKDFSIEGKHSGKDMSVFTLANAFLMRDKKQAWTLFTTFLNQGVAAEELHGILLWQCKMMLRVMSGGGAKDVGMKPFVYKKTKRGTAQWKHEEVENTYFSLVAAAHGDDRQYLGEIIEAKLLGL